MLKQLGIPVLGVVENMSFYAARERVQHEIFGPSHVEELAAAIAPPAPQPWRLILRLPCLECRQD
jgi:Mrp family chromosome partitioning ATPase